MSLKRKIDSEASETLYSKCYDFIRKSHGLFVDPYEEKKGDVQAKLENLMEELNKVSTVQDVIAYYDKVDTKDFLLNIYNNKADCIGGVYLQDNEKQFEGLFDASKLKPICHIDNQALYYLVNSMGRYKAVIKNSAYSKLITISVAKLIYITMDRYNFVGTNKFIITWQCPSTRYLAECEEFIEELCGRSYDFSQEPYSIFSKLDQTGLYREFRLIQEINIARYDYINKVSSLQTIIQGISALKEPSGDETKTKAKKPCISCDLNESIIAFDCGHYVFCKNCAVNWLKIQCTCPTCRKPVESFLRLYE